MSAPLFLHDDNLLTLLSPLESVSVVENYLRVRAQTPPPSPPRWRMEAASQGRLALAAGGDGMGFGLWAGWQAGGDDSQAVTLVWEKGILRGGVVGGLLRAYALGALGAVTLKYLAPFEATQVALLGTGQAAFALLQASLAVRPALRSVRVYSPTPAHRTAFISDVRALYTGLDLRDLPDAASAVRGADVVIAATHSPTPVLEAAWLKNGAHVVSTGGKGATKQEIGADTLARAAFLCTDAPEYAAAHADSPPALRKAYDLAGVVAGFVGKPHEEAVSLALLYGVAGATVALARHLLAKRLNAWPRDDAPSQ